MDNKFILEDVDTIEMVLDTGVKNIYEYIIPKDIINWGFGINMTGDYPDTEKVTIQEIISNVYASGRLCLLTIQLDENTVIYSEPFTINSKLNTYTIYEEPDGLYRLSVTGAWENNNFVCNSLLRTKHANYLAKDNTTEYTPTGNYNPVTKLYVDESIANIPVNEGPIKTFVIKYHFVTVINGALNVDEYIDIFQEMLECSLNGEPYMLKVINLYNGQPDVLDMYESTTRNGSFELSGTHNDEKYQFYLRFRINYDTNTNTVQQGNKHIVNASTRGIVFNNVNDTITQKWNFQVLPTSSVEPESDTHLTTKKYVDDSIKTAITDALGGEY